MTEPPTPTAIDGIPILVEGQGEQALVMVHGWPDSAALWQAQVAHFAPHFRCVRFTLPGFDVQATPRALSLDDTVEFLRRVVETVSPGRPVTLMIHDWGAVFGFELAMRHPQLVARIVAIDVADPRSRAWRREVGPRALLGAVAYQLWLALAWGIGRHLSSGLGHRMTRWMARALRAPAPSERIGWGMNYPYAITWFGLLGGYPLQRVQPACPVFYAWGTRKPFMFHSSRWLQWLAADPRHHAQAFQANHWVMVKAADAFNSAVMRWLTR